MTSVQPIFISRSDLIATHTAMLMHTGCLPVAGFPGYFVSRFGDVYSVNGQGFPTRKLSPGVKPGGYEFLALSTDNGPKYRMVHRLVAEAFIENPYDLPEVNHRDGNKRNNRAENLEWVTRKQNAIHAFDIGLQQRGSKSPFAKLNAEQVRAIRDATGFYRDIGAAYGVCAQTVCNIKNRKRYADVQ